MRHIKLDHHFRWPYCVTESQATRWVSMRQRRGRGRGRGVGVGVGEGLGPRAEGLGLRA